MSLLHFGDIELECDRFHVAYTSGSLDHYDNRLDFESPWTHGKFWISDENKHCPMGLEIMKRFPFEFYFDAKIRIGLMPEKSVAIDGFFLCAKNKVTEIVNPMHPPYYIDFLRRRKINRNVTITHLLSELAPCTTPTKSRLSRFAWDRKLGQNAIGDSWSERDVLYVEGRIRSTATHISA